MIGMATAVSTAFERRSALFAGVCLLLITGVALLYAGVKLPPIAAFLPIYTTLAASADGLTAFLLFGQARANRRPGLNFLAAAYAYCCFVIVAQVLVFPGLFSPSGLLGASSQTAVWFWVWWHGGFPLLVAVYVIADRRFSSRGDRGRQSQAFAVVCAAAVGSLVALLLALTVHYDRILPPLIVKGSYHALISSGIGPAVIGTYLIAVALLARASRLRTVTSIWLSVALVAMLLDVTLTLAGGGRFTLGWYVARIESLVAAFVVLLSFLGAISRMYEQLAHAASVDALTGIPNRRAFDERLPAARDAALRSALPLSIVMLDVDYFKNFNDHYGHVAGDDCLRAVADAATSQLTRRIDLLARYGGEEFAMVLLGTDQSGALRVAERVRSAIVARAVPHEKSPAGIVTASLGVFSFEPGAAAMMSTAELVRRADEALYTAKTRGRNGVAAYEETALADAS